MQKSERKGKTISFNLQGTSSHEKSVSEEKSPDKIALKKSGEDLEKMATLHQNQIPATQKQVGSLLVSGTPLSSWGILFLFLGFQAARLKVERPVGHA